MGNGTSGMLGAIVNDPSMALLERGMDLASTRHRAIANNIANANTPGYKRRDLSFEGVMRQVASSGAGSGDFNAERLVRIDSSRTIRNDGNNVDIDYEMTLLAENSIMYNALVRQLTHKISLLRSVITEGRR